MLQSLRRQTVNKNSPDNAVVDHVSKTKRSQIMRAVRNTDTAPEIAVRRTAHGLGLRYRLHNRELPGKPDLVFPRWGVCLLVHGCFWHRHPGCPRATVPKTESEFWLEKLTKNVERDMRVKKQLESLGWQVATIWECETKKPEVLKGLLLNIFCCNAGDGPNQPKRRPRTVKESQSMESST